MRKGIIYFLILMVSSAYCYDTFKYLTQSLHDSDVSWVKDFHCEERGAESEESNEKNEKLNFSEDLFCHQNLISIRLIYNGPTSIRPDNFSSSDFSQVVFSPPENLFSI